MSALGQHTLFDLHGCDPAALADQTVVRLALLEAVRRCGGTIVTDVFHQFSPHGVSGVVVIAESHLTIHTWPEHGFAAVDLFTCSATLDHSVARGFLIEAFGAASCECQRLERGARLG